MPPGDGTGRLGVSQLIEVLQNKQRMATTDDPCVHIEGDKLVVDDIQSEKFNYVVLGGRP